jgi:hypothetical protein
MRARSVAPALCIWVHQQKTPPLIHPSKSLTAGRHILPAVCCPCTATTVSLVLISKPIDSVTCPVFAPAGRAHHDGGETRGSSSRVRACTAAGTQGGGGGGRRHRPRCGLKSPHLKVPDARRWRCAEQLGNCEARLAGVCSTVVRACQLRWQHGRAGTCRQKADKEPW